MCRKFALIWNIESISAEELVEHIRKLLRVYVIFLVISIVSIVFAESTAALIIDGVEIGLYAVGIVAIYNLTSRANALNAIFPLVVACALFVVETIELIYTAAVSGSLWGLFSVISLILQLGTIYILYKAREKLLVEEAGGSSGSAAGSDSGPSSDGAAPSVAPVTTNATRSPLLTANEVAVAANESGSGKLGQSTPVANVV